MKMHKRESDEELRRRKRANFQRVRKLGQQFNYIAGPSQVYASNPTPTAPASGTGAGADAGGAMGV